MAARRRSRHDAAALDALISEIIADAEDVEEQVSGFGDFIGELIGDGVEATVIGEEVDLVGVHAGELREGLLATLNPGDARLRGDVPCHSADRLGRCSAAREDATGVHGQRPEPLLDVPGPKDDRRLPAHGLSGLPERHQGRSGKWRARGGRTWWSDATSSIGGSIARTPRRRG